MNVMVFDTETTSLDKPFCYNIGYVITDTDTREILVKRDFVVEQIWHNLPLFATAYYAAKRASYVLEMRRRKTVMDKWGYIMKRMKRDIRDFNVLSAYAYNSPFDDKVLAFNCDWFKTNNPFDTIPIYDIRGYANSFITNTEEYRNFCEDYEFFTDSGNYPATAETVYRYIMSFPDFVEAHTALSDSEIESEILLHCLDLGAELDKDYLVQKVIARKVSKPFTIKVDGDTTYSGQYTSKYCREGLYSFKTK